MKVIGIDMGTSTISGVVADSISGAVLAVRNIPNKSTVSTPNGWERIQDGDKACQAAKAVLDQLLTRCPDVQRIGQAADRADPGKDRAFCPLRLWAGDAFISG